MTIYSAFKGDLVESRKAEDREAVQEQLLAVVDAANSYFTAWIVAKLIVTHGDEFQGLLSLDGARQFVSIYEFFRAKLKLRLRMALGVGPLETALQSVAIAMDGPAWHRAKYALEQAAVKGIPLHVELPSPFLTRQANLLLLVMSEIEDGWRPSHRETIALLQQERSQEEVARQLGITQGAVSQRLSHARWRTYQELKSAVAGILSAADIAKVPPFDH